MLSRKVAAGFAATLVLFVGAANARAGSTGSDPLDETISNFTAQAKAVGGSAPISLSAGTAPLAKFSASGRINETIAAGGCANNPTLTSLECSPSTNCDALTMTGQVTATGLGKSNLDACLIIVLSSSSGACLNGLGIGTLTAANGNKINISFGGDFCVADENMSTLTIFFNSNLSYAVEGGTGPFATETGNGNLTTSDILVNPGSLPFAGTGQFNMSGIVSKN
jgi:hypothetical protein